MELFLVLALILFLVVIWLLEKIGFDLDDPDTQRKIGDFFENFSAKKRVNKKLINNHPPEREIKGFVWWRNNIEPKYAEKHTYPPDWNKRRAYTTKQTTKKHGRDV